MSSMEKEPAATSESIPGVSREIEAIELLARQEEQVLQASLGIVAQAEPPIARKEQSTRPRGEI